MLIEVSVDKVQLSLFSPFSAVTPILFFSGLSLSQTVSDNGVVKFSTKAMTNKILLNILPHIFDFIVGEHRW